MGRKCKVGGCSYEHWSRAKHAMVHCGRKEDRPGSHLCAFHREWWKDCTGAWSRGKGSHPSNWNWLDRAMKAYGIKAMGFPLPPPSDAGKIPKIWGTC
jgi:hypothetical protein